MGKSVRRRGVILSLLAILVVSAAVSASVGQARSEKGNYTLGLSNTLVGNGWRVGMGCAFKAQALASGEVKSVKIAHRQTDTAGQISDIRAMISAGVDAIIINPSSPTALKPVAAQAIAKGIDIPFVVPGLAIPVAFVVSVCVGVIFGVFPARKAARLNPLAALRFE